LSMGQVWKDAHLAGEKGSKENKRRRKKGRDRGETSKVALGNSDHADESRLHAGRKKTSPPEKNDEPEKRKGGLRGKLQLTKKEPEFFTFPHESRRSRGRNLKVKGSRLRRNTLRNQESKNFR